MRDIIKAIRFIRKMNPIEREAIVLELEEIHELMDSVDAMYGSETTQKEFRKAQRNYQSKRDEFLERLEKQIRATRPLDYSVWYKLWKIFVKRENEYLVLDK